MGHYSQFALSDLISIKSKIMGLSLQIKKEKKKFRKWMKDKKNYIPYLSLKSELRYLNIAYALVRGVSIFKIERNSKSKISPISVYSIINSYPYLASNWNFIMVCSALGLDAANYHYPPYSSSLFNFCVCSNCSK